VRARDFVKEEDILDVWFDSGVSYAAVLEERQDLRFPADLYLEGSDQHRGWFQSSLLAAVGTRDTAPYRSVLTHGFVVDGQGKKMSKSIGNVIKPEEIIDQYGGEILRLWVASEDYKDEIKISDEILKQLSDAYRKIRNTVRFILGNLYDFNPDEHSVEESRMDELDRWALMQLELLKKKVRQAYDSFEFHPVFHGIYNFCTVSMSALYLDVLKDRLYTLPAGSVERRAAQTALYEIADSLVRLMAPVLTFMAAEVWEFLPEKQGREGNVFVALFPEAKEHRLGDEGLRLKWDKLLAVRSELTKVLERARQDKVIGHSLEAEVSVCAAGELGTFLQDNWETLKTMTIVSGMVLTEQLPAPGIVSDEFPALSVLVQAARGEKCERCWTRAETVGASSEHPTLCSRCVSVVAAI
jgi:isoleucyl-tRNA synthetase